MCVCVLLKVELLRGLRNATLSSERRASVAAAAYFCHLFPSVLGSAAAPAVHISIKSADKPELFSD